MPVREAGGRVIDPSDPDVAHAVLRHGSGALSSLVSSQAIQRYRRPALELYGTEGTANLLGDDWDPRGFEIWRNELGRWEEHEAIDGTWLWADGLRECVAALREGRKPLQEPQQDLHVLDVVDAARAAVRERRAWRWRRAFRRSISPSRLPERPAARPRPHPSGRRADVSSAAEPTKGEPRPTRS